MKIDKAVDIILTGVKLKRHELIVGGIIYHIIPRINHVFSFLSAAFGDFLYKRQIRVI
jgi:hypothetical protein